MASCRISYACLSVMFGASKFFVNLVSESVMVRTFSRKKENAYIEVVGCLTLDNSCLVFSTTSDLILSSVDDSSLGLFFLFAIEDILLIICVHGEK